MEPSFEIRTLSDRYRIVKVYPPKKMFRVNSGVITGVGIHSSEEKVCEIILSPDSDQYCKIICKALNKKYKTRKAKAE